MSRPAGKVLVAQQEAIWNYLDALLQEIPEDLDAAPVTEEIQEWDPAALAVVETPAVSVVVEAEPEPVMLDPEPDVVEASVALAEPESVAVVEPNAAVTQPEPVVVAPVAEEVPPGWSKPEFQALLFKVGALNLAVPLIKLHSVIPWPEEGIAAMPNQPSWCYGLLRYRDQNVRIIDTAELVLPPDKRREPIEPKHVLIVGDGRWGLACSSIGEVLRLEPDEVKWRTAEGRRRWLAGTVVGHLCALLDTEAFADMLGDTGRRR